MQLTEIVAQNADFQALQAAMTATPGQRHLLTGMTGSAKTTYLAALQEVTQQPMIVVADSQYHAEQLYEDLQALRGETHVGLFPAEDSLANEVGVTSLNVLVDRVDALIKLQRDPLAVVVTSVNGSTRALPPVAEFTAGQMTVTAGQDYDLSELGSRLMSMGYQKTAMVEQPGDYAIRGSIVDLYPLKELQPVRLDFFDTELESLHYFDASTQRNGAELTALTVVPATDLVATPARLAETKTRLDLALTDARDQLAGAAKRHLTEALAPLMDALDAGHLHPLIREYLPLLYPEATSLFDYLPATGIVVFDEYARALEESATLQAQDLDWWEQRVAEHLALPLVAPARTLADQVAQVQQTNLLTSGLQRTIGRFKFATTTHVAMRPMQQFFSQMPLLKNEVSRWQARQDTVVFLSNTAERQAKLAETLAEFDIKANQTRPNELTPGRTEISVLPLQGGFEWADQHLVVLTEKELFEQIRKKPVRNQALSNAERIKNYSDLNVGDYVVHTNHGIGIYEGMETIAQNGVNQDYITIAYQQDAKLFIPVSQLDLVQKYVGAAEKAPKINKLGGTEWQKTRNKVAKKVEDIADDLLDLYAERELQRGFAFPADDAEMTSFEDAFPYPETPDQLRSTAEIKQDMEKVQPMDRLLVGDVGFGKTEVAMRAAFKAAHAGKQVAVLVPTTILAQQHFETFKRRFEGTGIRIGVLSRFQTPKEVKALLAELTEHTIDIVIGTHRILSKDLAFADLGLLVIDEEQRFGVKHKERLKTLQHQVDTLTLTATPIPRTLNMSMMGVRDLSVIETPPANRFPIQTYVLEQQAPILSQAIRREMDRGGQVYYVHNRVEDIEQVVAMLSELVPEARIGYIHGQMTEAQLDGVLSDFIQREYDVLVTTTIIETGVDIPNANTLIVENADHMGLAQLYQLRGRVGRSNNVAYAYFTYPVTRTLNEESEKRLAAIRDFTELGSGFKIAMRDLSIRGAGDVLGQNQHGFINTVGYDLYMQMLNEAIARKQGKDQGPKRIAELDLQVDAYLPDTYIMDAPQKIELYQRIRKATTLPALTEIGADLVERFGSLPLPAETLLAATRVKVLADQHEVLKIKRTNAILEIQFAPESAVTPEMVTEALAQDNLTGQLKVSAQKAVLMPIQPNETPLIWLGHIGQFLANLPNGVEVAHD